MVYITSDGRVLQNRPWGLQRLGDIFWGAIDFITLFFRSLVGLDPASIQSRSSGSGRGGGGGGGGPRGPGNGGPRPPRRMGQVTTIQDCSMPGGG